MNGQKQMNDNISEKFLANDKILESLAMQLDVFNSVIKHQLSFNELLETKVTHWPHPALTMTRESYPGNRK